MIDRRSTLGIVASAMLSRGVGAQTPGRAYRLGLLHLGTPPVRPDGAGADAFAGPLRDLGYVEGHNLVVERRYAHDQPDRLPALARELVELRVDAILAVSTSAAHAAKQATPTIPIVFLNNGDPVAAGLVANLARTGNNLTGVLITPEGSLANKRVELLTQAVAQPKRIALLVPDIASTFAQLQIDETRSAATSLGLAMDVVKVEGGHYARAFAALAALRTQALVVGANPFFLRDRKTIIDLAAQHKVPAIYEWSRQVYEGGLMSYGASDTETYKQVASYIDRIFDGAKPSDLPVWQPSRLLLVINLKTARALGLVIPQSLLLRADEVIE